MLTLDFISKIGSNGRVIPHLSLLNNANTFNGLFVCIQFIQVRVHEETEVGKNTANAVLTIHFLNINIKDSFHFSIKKKNTKIQKYKLQIQQTS